MNFKNFVLWLISTLLIFIMVGLYFFQDELKQKYYDSVNSFNQDKKNDSIKKARIVANGDILYHDVLYWSAQKNDGSYDFEPYFEYVKDRIATADLAIGDYEGTISDRHPLNGYPLFNAPKEAALGMKNVGYDVVDLAHNHILDSGVYGLQTTYFEFQNLGLSPIGIHVEKNRDRADILVKEVNGIKIAFLAYAYGYNGFENSISKEDYNYFLSDLNEEKMKKEIEKAEQLADVTVIMPQMGVEYSLQPTEEQVELYHKMISWGADVVLGGHPHVVEPAEIVEHNGDKKLIMYSMGNFISNQRYEMMTGLGQVAKWPERGVLMDLEFEKKADKTIIKNAKALPTQVLANKNGRFSRNGYPLFDYRVVVIEDFLSGGKYADKIDEKTRSMLELSKQEMDEHVKLNWDN